jgi:hypothetical protein
LPKSILNLHAALFTSLEHLHDTPPAMSNPNVPLRVLPASIVTYGVAHRILSRCASPGSKMMLLEAISGAHAAGMTLATLLALRQSPLHFYSNQTRGELHYRSDGNLDDSKNPMIQEQSDLANAITAWETGYLIYDTWGMVQYSSPTSGIFRSISAAAQSNPFEFAHHTGLATALLYLQYYIWKGNERGIWIIVALTLMNASTPLLRIRSWAAHQGKRSKTLDVAFAVSFALSRMGVIFWILQRYGAHHGLNAWSAYLKLRLPCQAGTGAIFGLNTAWWLLLLRSMARRHWR